MKVKVHTCSLSHLCCLRLSAGAASNFSTLSRYLVGGARHCCCALAAAAAAAAPLMASLCVGFGRCAKRASTSLCACLYTQNSHKRQVHCSVARLKMDLPFHNRLAYNRVHRRSASPLGGAHRGRSGEGAAQHLAVAASGQPAPVIRDDDRARLFLGVPDAVRVVVI